MKKLISVLIAVIAITVICIIMHPHKIVSDINSLWEHDIYSAKQLKKSGSTAALTLISKSSADMNIKNGNELNRLIPVIDNIEFFEDINEVSITINNDYNDMVLFSMLLKKVGQQFYIYKIECGFLMIYNDMLSCFDLSYLEILDYYGEAFVYTDPSLNKMHNICQCTNLKKLTIRSMDSKYFFDFELLFENLPKLEFFRFQGQYNYSYTPDDEECENFEQMRERLKQNYPECEIRIT